MRLDEAQNRIIELKNSSKAFSTVLQVEESLIALDLLTAGNERLGRFWVRDGAKIVGAIGRAPGCLGNLAVLEVLQAKPGRFEIAIGQSVPPGCVADVDVAPLASDQSSALASLEQRIKTSPSPPLTGAEPTIYQILDEQARERPLMSGGKSDDLSLINRDPEGPGGVTAKRAQPRSNLKAVLRAVAAATVALGITASALLGLKRYQEQVETDRATASRVEANYVIDSSQRSNSDFRQAAPVSAAPPATTTEDDTLLPATHKYRWVGLLTPSVRNGSS